MNSSISTSTLALVLALVLATCTDACFSEGRRLLLMKQYEKDAKDLGLKKTEIQCLLARGDSYAPEEHEVHGQVFKCYHDQDYSVHMVNAMTDCIDDMSSVTERTLANGEKQVVEPTVPSRVLRRPVEPSSPMGKVANWLGLKETVRDACSCTSGCHYCCINTVISGDDFCFRLHCRGIGFCS